MLSAVFTVQIESEVAFVYTDIVSTIVDQSGFTISRINVILHYNNGLIIPFPVLYFPIVIDVALNSTYRSAELLKSMIGDMI